MNQIYKVIWSRVRRCYVVVSEIAGSCGKKHLKNNDQCSYKTGILTAVILKICISYETDSRIK